MLINIIGAGHLGKTLGYLLVKNQLVTIGCICNTTMQTAMDAIKFIGDGSVCQSISELLPADITFITTPDDLISTICEELSNNTLIAPGSIVLHCSGALTSDVLCFAKEKGAYIASVHPMRSFARPDLSIEEYNGTYCAMEGDKEAIALLKPIFNSIGSITYEINKTKKSLYHASGVFASNYLVTLSHQAFLCLQEAGVDDNLAMFMIINIMQGTLSNLKKTLSPKLSLTGPIQRGEISTLKQHMESFTELIQQKLYSLLGQATIPLTTTHDDTKIALIKEALTSCENSTKISRNIEKLSCTKNISILTIKPTYKKPIS